MTRTGDSSHWHSMYARVTSLAWYLTKQEYADTRVTAGTAAVPSLGINASAVVQVTLSAAMTSTDYNPTAVLTGSLQLLGALEITATTVATTSRVDVTVKNTGLLTLSGATVLVIALKT